MLRGPGDRDPRHTTQLPDNKRDTSVKGSEDGTPPISRSQFAAAPAGQHARDPLAGHNALQESAYRLHALVKRSSPQKPARSPIRFNKTAPLPSMGKSLSAPKRAAGGPATGRISKAPPSPRRSPLRGGGAREADAAAAPPQTKNVVERMIAYARHAASQEDPGMVQRDRQNFVTRLADRSLAGAASSSTGERAGASGPQTPKESPLVSQSAYPIMSNLSVHANLRRQTAAHTAPVGPDERGDEVEGRRPLHRRASSAAETAPELREPSRSEPGRSEQVRIEQVRTERGGERGGDRLNEALFDPLTAELNRPLPAAASARASAALGRDSHDGYAAGAHAHYSASACTASAPSTPPRSTHHAAQSPPSLGTPRARLGAAAQARSTAAAWDKERWRVFIQAVRESFGASGVPATNAIDVFNELMHRLPPDMRGISVQEMVHRLNAWIRSTARAAPP